MSNLNRYTVLPFTGERFQQNEKKLRDGETPCAICGKAVKHPYKHAATVVHGGDWAATEAEAAKEDHPGYMGVWGIGDDCHRKYLAPAADQDSTV